MKQKPLYTKIWKNRISGISGGDSVRACINSNKENFSIDVSYYTRQQQCADHTTPPQPFALIEIELPNGNTWSGSITELQNLIAPRIS